MKYSSKIVSIIILVGLSVFIGSCRDDNSDKEPSLLDLQLESLLNSGNSWELAPEGVFKDGYDVTDQFVGFVLTIRDKTYTTLNGKLPVWPSTGNWDFQNDNPNLILRDNNTSITIDLYGDTMTLTFTANSIDSSGRANGISGEYQFRLTSK